MSRFKKQEEVFKKEMMPPDNKRPWYYSKPTEQKAYENWIAQVVDPVTQEFYKSHDNPPRLNRHVIQTIIRVRIPSGEEKLYTVGTLIGYNSFGDEKKTDAYRPEVAEMTRFGHETQLGKNNQLVQQSTGPLDTYLEYSLDFTPENVDMLYKQRETNGITYAVRDETTGLDIVVRGKTPVESLDLFRNKDFDYLFNADYRSREDLEKEEKDDKGKK